MKKVLFKISVLFFALIFMCNVFAGGDYSPDNDVSTDADVSVSAQSYCLMECASGQIALQSNANKRLPMASTTKIMTAIVAIENTPLKKVVTVSADACGIEGSSVYLCKNEKLTAEELLYALMLESANDAACALAIEVGGTVENFVSMMNSKAEELGLENTHFSNPHGLGDDEHYTTAADLATLMCYCMKNEAFACITSTKKLALQGSDDSYSRLLVNHNKLLGTFDGITGGKTGYTKQSGRCLVTFCERNGVQLCAVTLNAPDDWNDHKSLYTYGFTFYKRVSLEKAGQREYTSPVCGGTCDSVIAKTKDDMHATLKTDSKDISRVVYMQRFYYPNIEQGDILGSVNYFCNGKLIASAPLYATHSVKAAEDERSFFEKLKDFIS